MAEQRPWYILPVLITAQLCGTSLWFAGNAVLGDLGRELSLPAAAVGAMTSSVQLGFIAGTLLMASLGLADRFSARGLFLLSALLGAAFNAGLTLVEDGTALIFVLRFLTGCALAGIYPVGMKIASSWYRDGLGAALGWLVGALVLGTALPQGMRAMDASLPWRTVIISLSAIAASGGLALFVLVPDGPHAVAGAPFRPRMLVGLFREAKFRAAAFGYFGHMWELYAFWALVPTLVGLSMADQASNAAWSFAVIAAGFLACGLGGQVSLRAGSRSVARSMLACSGLACCVAPLVLGTSGVASLGLLLVWGFAVVGDSPQFSTLVAGAAPRDRVGTALTLVNCIGFALTIPAIELLNWAAQRGDPRWAVLLLAPGPAFGLWASRARGDG